MVRIVRDIRVLSSDCSVIGPRPNPANRAYERRFSPAALCMRPRRSPSAVRTATRRFHAPSWFFRKALPLSSTCWLCTHQMRSWVRRSKNAYILDPFIANSGPYCEYTMLSMARLWKARARRVASGRHVWRVAGAVLALILPFGIFSLSAQEVPAQSEPRPQAESPASGQPAAAPASESEKRTQLNLVSQTDTQAGESRRNENVPVTPLDSNLLKDANLRLGITATPIVEFRPDQTYYGAEYGNPPLHRPARPRAFRPRYPRPPLRRPPEQHLQRAFLLPGRRGEALTRKRLRL